jgi:hypothetical protein
VPEFTIHAMQSSGDQFPAYIAGPVVASAALVKVEFADGQTRELPTFEAPKALGRVCFFRRSAGDGRLRFMALGSAEAHRARRTWRRRCLLRQDKGSKLGPRRLSVMRVGWRIDHFVNA